MKRNYPRASRGLRTRSGRHSVSGTACSPRRCRPGSRRPKRASTPTCTIRTVSICSCDGRTREVVGTYRILPGDRARRAGGFYSETEFDLGGVAALPGLVEIGRACVHPDYRNGAVIRLLWAGLTRYLLGHGYEFVIGCASMPAEDAHNVRAVHRELAEHHLSPSPWRGKTRVPFPPREEPSGPHVPLP